MTAKQELQATEQKKGPGEAGEVHGRVQEECSGLLPQQRQDTGKAEIADDLGIPRKTKQVGAGRAEGRTRREAAGEIRKLRREVERLQEENAFLKAAAFFAASQDATSPDWIAAEKGGFGVSTMCRALGIARSSFCGWAARSPEEKDPWAAVREAVLELWESSEGRWGARTIHAMLPDEFAGTTLYRIRKCMHELGIQGSIPGSPGAPPSPTRMRRSAPTSCSGTSSRPSRRPCSAATSPTCGRWRAGCIWPR